MKRLVNGELHEFDPSFEAEIGELSDRLAVRTKAGMRTSVVVRVGDAAHVSFLGRQYVVERSAGSRRATKLPHSGKIHAPMPGQIVDVFVAAGDTVLRGEKMLVLEAMKTQQAFVAPFDGTIETVNAVKGGQTHEGELLVRVLPWEQKPQ